MTDQSQDAVKILAEVSKEADPIAALQRRLLAPLESIVRDANRQIRATKLRLKIPSASGVILIFNESNQLHRSPEHFANLMGHVIQKPANKGGRRFPHIDGMVYFSLLSVTTHDEQTHKDLSIWMPAQVAGESVQLVKDFQDALKIGWYIYLEKISGLAVERHLREMHWPSGNSVS